jgi:hypothetical protein
VREDLLSGEWHDLCPAKGDGKMPIGWARSIDQACTAWLLKRGLYGSRVPHDLRPTPGSESEEDETDIGPGTVRVNGLVFRRRRLRAAAEFPAPAVPGTGTEDRDHAARVPGEEKAQ